MAREINYEPGKNKKSKMHLPMFVVSKDHILRHPKLTPVGRSLGRKFGFLYDGRSSLIPNSSTEKKN